MSTDLPERLTMTKCPCGRCEKYIVQPLFGCQCSSLNKEEAEELVKRWNSYDGLERKAYPDPKET